VAADLGVERAILVAVALASLVFGPLAAVIGDDLGHVTAYLAIAATGLGLLGVSAIDPGAWAPTRAWMAMTAVSATGLVAFSMVLGRAYGTRWLPDLRGWARRSPVLAVAFAILGLAMVGAPGMAALDARTALVDGAVEGPLTAVARLLLIAPLVPLLRVLVLGLAPIGATVRDGRSEWPRRPERWTAREPAAIADRARALATDAAVTGRLDRLPAASAIVLVLALLAGLVASGAIDLAAAAAEPAPGVTSPFEPGAGELSPDGELDGGEATPGPDGSAGQGDVSPSP
jgi:formate hydrogenlyase subunit 3/multisubunit Na+/H+ antiporter MnhD subunit